MEIKVTIDASEGLKELARELARALSGRYVTVSSQPMGEVEETGGEASAESADTADTGNQEPATPAPVVTAEEVNQESSTPAEVSYPDDTELKQHMDMAISKFAGNGWRESQDGRVLAIRKRCTKAFKEIAKWLGAEKPTALEGDKRLTFLHQVANLTIEETEGKMPEVRWLPF